MKKIQLEKMLGVEGTLLSPLNVTCEVIELDVAPYWGIYPQRLKYPGRPCIDPVQIHLSEVYQLGDKIPVIDTAKFILYGSVVTELHYTPHADYPQYTIHISHIKVKE